MKRLGTLGLGLALLWGTAARAADTVYYYYTDEQGTPEVMADAQGNVVERTQYAPYGQVLNRPEHDGPGYTGHEEDSATGLTNMQQRYDDKVVGRFLSVDPVQPDGSTGGSFNRYAYANDNPYRYTDPDGRQGATKQCGDNGCNPDNQTNCTGSLTCHTDSENLKVRVVDDSYRRGAPIHGKAQNSRNTPTHASTSQRIANEAAGDADTDRVHLNQRLSTVTGDQTAPKIQPDITVVNKNGTIDMYEVRSAGQSQAELISKLADARAGLGVGGRNLVVEPDPLPMGGGMVLRGLGPLGIIEMVLHQIADERQAEKAAAVAAQRDPVCHGDPNCI